MRDVVTIFAFTVSVSLLYTAVAQVLPQLENHPPPVVALGSDIGPEELAPIGAAAFEANCVSCHKMGEAGRAPDLASIGAIAHDRAAERAASTGEKFTDADYLMEALCKPGDYIVEGFGNIMPPQGKALSGGQLLAVVAFLQSLGSEPTARGTDEERVHRFECVQGGASGGGGAVAAAKPASVGTPEKAFQKFGCSGCHAIDSADRGIGPGLGDVGKRLSKGDLYEALLAPDATIAVGDPPYAGGVMKQTLDGNSFYESMTPADYQAMVEWLAAHKG